MEPIIVSLLKDGGLVDGIGHADGRPAVHLTERGRRLSRAVGRAAIGALLGWDHLRSFAADARSRRMQPAPIAVRSETRYR